MKRYFIFSCMFMLLIGLTGCGKNQNSAPNAIVDTKEIQEEQIIETINSTGRIIAEYDVAIVARVDGYLQKRFFEEGSFVHKGDLLYQIEPNTYAARVNEASANLRNAQAALKDSSKNLTRAEQLVKMDYISKADYDNKLALRDKDRASVDSNRAALTQAQINYGYTKIYAPVSGKIGKMFITEGNYVTPSSGTLATLVSLDPIFVDFTLKSRDYLMLKKASKVDDLSDISIDIKLADDTIYPQKGKIKFIDNTVDMTSGSVDVRAVFNNAKYLLVPGDFVAVTVTLNTPRKVIMIPQESVLESVDGKYVFVIDKDKKAEKRFVKVGDEYKRNWIIEEGITAGEIVATTGLQRIVEGQKVTLTSDMKAQKADKAKKPSLFSKIKNKLKTKVRF